MGNVSIGQLFVGGIVPGVLMTVFLMGTAWIIAKRRGYQPESARPPKLREVLASLWDCKWALLFPVFLIVGIRYGVFTPSEAGAFAVAYAIAVGLLVYRELTWGKLMASLRQSMVDNGMIMLIIMLSAMIGYMITLEGVPQTATTYLASITQHPGLLMLLLIAFIVALGMFLESTVIVLLLTPILVPVVTRLGIDPVHFGLVMMTCVTLGSMTPPVGVAMFTVCGMLNCPMDEYTREAMPLLGAVIVLVVLMIFVPDIVLLLPRLAFA
jgi:tripartite ATP-independent transporter DctM subunit